MLTELNISNIVLIEKLNLQFSKGLNVLTGETGAGKSILLDALALGLGARSDTGLIRHGCEVASVTVSFDNLNDEIKKILEDNGIEYEDGMLILRRTLTQEGKNKAWINDVPVSIKTLKQIGDLLVEIHGQFANHTLLNPSTHRQALDDFACQNISGFNELLKQVKESYLNYHGTETKLKELKELLASSAAERDFLQHNVSELKALNVQVGEEETLANKRAVMMNAEKDASILDEANQALNIGGKGLDSVIFSVAHVLERIKTSPNPYQNQIDKLYDMGSALSEIAEQLTPLEIDTESLESIEERLFAIRAAARKHRVSADELPEKLADMERQLNTIDNSDSELKKLEKELSIKEKEYKQLSEKLSDLRKNAADNLRNKILAELPDLKLGQADFMVEITEGADSSYGKDDIVFMIKTNPGMPFAPLHKAASGGELARLMLALRVVLANKQESSYTFVFDEVDTGISGATASAVGFRLSKLAENGQALVITHSAQVAGFANKHFKIEKHVTNDTTITTVSEIKGEDRINEIARIISGAEITPEAIATAKTLIKF